MYIGQYKIDYSKTELQNFKDCAIDFIKKHYEYEAADQVEILEIGTPVTYRVNYYRTGYEEQTYDARVAVKYSAPGVSSRTIALKYQRLDIGRIVKPSLASSSPQGGGFFSKLAVDLMFEFGLPPQSMFEKTFAQAMGSTYEIYKLQAKPESLLFRGFTYYTTVKATAT